MKKILNKKSGFTLIELLVVVAIIGVLASIVLASLNSARAKGIDAAIKGTLANSRAQAALFYDNNSNSVSYAQSDQSHSLEIESRSELSSRYQS